MDSVVQVPQNEYIDMIQDSIRAKMLENAVKHSVPNKYVMAIIYNKDIKDTETDITETECP